MRCCGWHAGNLHSQLYSHVPFISMYLNEWRHCFVGEGFHFKVNLSCVDGFELAVHLCQVKTVIIQQNQDKRFSSQVSFKLMSVSFLCSHTSCALNIVKCDLAARLRRPVVSGELVQAAAERGGQRASSLPPSSSQPNQRQQHPESQAASWAGHGALMPDWHYPATVSSFSSSVFFFFVRK